VSYLGLPEPTNGQYHLAHQMQHGPQRLITMCFRGFGKSWIAAAYCVWLLWKDQTLNVLVCSASAERAVDFTQFCLRLLEMPELAHLMPRDDDRRRMDRFDVHGAPVMQSANLVALGVFGQMTGKRADIVVADDVEVPNTVETQGMREKLWTRSSEFTDLLKPEGPQRVICLGTPHSEDSIYNRLEQQRGFTKWIWPAQYPDQRLKTVYSDSLAQPLQEADLEAGQATDPQRFDDTVLAEKRSAKTPSEWALQYQLDTSLSDYLKHPLRLSDLIVMDIDPETAPEKLVWASGKDQRIEDKQLPCVGLSGDYYHRPLSIQGDWLPYEMKVMAIDPAGRGHDETGYAIVGTLNGYLYLLDAGGMMGGYEDTTLSKLAFLAQKWKVNEVILESNFGDGMYEQLFQPHLAQRWTTEWQCGIEEVRHNRQKELRICDTLEPLVAHHKLVVSPSVIRGDLDAYKLSNQVGEEKRRQLQLFFQMARISRDKGSLHHDDRLDALSMAAARVKDLVGRDADLLMERKQLEDFYEELNKDLEELGQVQDSPGWMWGTAAGTLF
jgi:hypothetical protein